MALNACRECGCTEQDACVETVAHIPCAWVEVDLCSSCVDLDESPVRRLAADDRARARRAREHGTAQILLKPTIAIEEGEAKVAQCASCGLIAAYRSVAAARLNKCPACAGTVWWPQHFNVGPFVVDDPEVATS